MTENSINRFSKLLPQLLSHIHAYAEILHSWNLIQKRTEMYKAIKTPDPYLSTPSPQGELGRHFFLADGLARANSYLFLC